MNGAAGGVRALDGHILLAGAGRMGAALLRGWIAAGAPAGFIVVEEPRPSPELLAFMDQAGVARGVAALPAPPKVVVLAMKPQSMDEALPPIAALCGPETVVLSIAAGRAVAGIGRHLPAGTPIVRAMPNTPAAIGRGVTAAFRGEGVSEEHAALCEALMRAVGDFVWVAEESLMDAVTAVSGSGPAYVFLLAECLAEAGRRAGLPDDLSARLARATVIGAGELLRLSPESARALRENVASPGGTTAAALGVLMGEQGLGPLMAEAVAAAARRSRELAS